MNIIIEESVREMFAAKNVAAVTVDIKGCSAWDLEPQPTVRLGEPRENRENFTEYDVDGIKAFVTSTARTKNGELKIALKRVLFTKKLVVEGLAF